MRGDTWCIRGRVDIARPWFDDLGMYGTKAAQASSHQSGGDRHGSADRSGYVAVDNFQFSPGGLVRDGRYLSFYKFAAVEADPDAGAYAVIHIVSILALWFAKTLADCEINDIAAPPPLLALKERRRVLKRQLALRGQAWMARLALQIGSQYERYDVFAQNS